MTFRLNFDTDDSDFDDDARGRIVQILREVAERIDRGNLSHNYLSIKDSNGNRIGGYRWREEEESA